MSGRTRLAAFILLIWATSVSQADETGDCVAFYQDVAARDFLDRDTSFASAFAASEHQWIHKAGYSQGRCECLKCQMRRRSQGAAGGGGSADGNSGGGGASAADATNPTASITQYQVQNTFIPTTYEADGFAHNLSLLMVKPFETGLDFFPSWITRTTLSIATTADPIGNEPVGPPNGGNFTSNLGRQSGLADLVFISIFNHPTDWGSWGIGPGFVAPTATRRELGERSWKFSPTFAVVNTAIETWQFGVLGVYNFPLDGRGTQSLLFQPLIVKQLGEGWYTGWGDDLWQFNTKTGGFDMPLQLRLGRVHKMCGKQFNTFVTGAYTPDGLRQGPAPEWGIKFSISLLKAD